MSESEKNIKCWCGKQPIHQGVAICEDCSRALQLTELSFMIEFIMEEFIDGKNVPESLKPIWEKIKSHNYSVRTG